MAACALSLSCVQVVARQCATLSYRYVVAVAVVVDDDVVVGVASLVSVVVVVVVVVDVVVVVAFVAADAVVVVMENNKLRTPSNPARAPSAGPLPEAAAAASRACVGLGWRSAGSGRHRYGQFSVPRFWISGGFTQGWNSHANREFPGKLESESTNLSREHLSREIVAGQGGASGCHVTIRINYGCSYLSSFSITAIVSYAVSTFVTATKY